MRFVLVNAVGGRPAGEVLDDLQGDAGTIAGLPGIGGILVPLPNPAMEAAAVLATQAYRRGAGDSTATGIMLGKLAKSSGGGGSVISWRLDGSGDATTWAEVYALIQASVAPVDVHVSENATYVIPAGAYDLSRGVSFSAPLGPSASIVNCADGVQLTVISGGFVISGGMRFVFNSTALPPLVFVLRLPGEAFIVIAQRAAQFQNNGTIPVINCTGGQAAAYGAFEAGGYQPGVTPFIQLDVGCIAIIESIALGFVFGGAANLVGGVVGSTVYWLNSGNLFFPLPPQPSFFGTTVNAAAGMVGGGGTTAERPVWPFGALSIGTLYFDTTLPALVVWDGAAWQLVSGAPPADLFPYRTDHSVNSARVDRLYDAKPILRTRSAGNAAGGYNGAGLGNKAILGFPVAFSAPLAPLASLEWTWLERQLGNVPGGVVYANILLDVNGDGSAWKIGVVDPSSAFLLNNGSTITNGDGSKTTTWLAASNNLLIVNGLEGPPLPPGVGFVPPTVPGAPLPAGWLSNSYSIADILAAYPGCKFGVGSSGDGGMPKAPNKTAAFLLVAGDSTNNLEEAWELRDVKFNGGAV